MFRSSLKKKQICIIFILPYFPMGQFVYDLYMFYSLVTKAYWCSATGPLVGCCVRLTYAPYTQTLHWQENNEAGDRHKRTFNSLWTTASLPSISQYSASITALPRDPLLAPPCSNSTHKPFYVHFSWVNAYTLQITMRSFTVEHWEILMLIH